MRINDNELAEFLEATKKKELDTWSQGRSSRELSGFVARRLAALDGVELDNFDGDLEEVF
jgi:hypothetical protein